MTRLALSSTVQSDWNGWSLTPNPGIKSLACVIQLAIPTNVWQRLRPILKTTMRLSSNAKGAC